MKFKLLYILILLLVLPLKVNAVYEVTDARCTNDIKVSLRSKATNISYKINKNIDSKASNVTYTVEFLNVDDDIYIVDSSNNKEYKNTFKIEGITPGANINFIMYAEDNTYCGGYLITSKAIQIPYYNKYSTNKLCSGYEDYTLCNENANISITEEDFEKRMKLYIESLKISTTTTSKEEKKDDTSNTFDIVSFIIRYNTYISGFGAILLVIYITVIINKKNKERGIL